MNLCLFDLDHTLLPLDSDHEFGEFIVRSGLADAAAYRERNDAFYRQYVDGSLVLSEYIDFTTHVWREMTAAQQAQLQARFMCEVIRPAILPPALALVEAHRQEGDLMAIVTATNEFVTRPIADAFGIDDLIAVQLARNDKGQVTGGIEGVPSFREGKITRVQEWLRHKGLHLGDFDRVFFYSDSPNDLPLLEMVSDPVATNPSESLAAHAMARGWRVLHLFK